MRGLKDVKQAMGCSGKAFSNQLGALPCLLAQVGFSHPLVCEQIRR